MDELIAFLLARLDEEEAAAKTATESPWAWEATGEKDNSWAIGLVQTEEGETISGRIDAGEGIVIDGVCESINGRLADAVHIIRHDPARVLREVEAGRMVLDLAATIMQSDIPVAFGSHKGAADALRLVLAAWATIYSDHPDYQEEWKP